ncbi:MAG: hypothetical protein AAF703_12155 [Cyanobacteria bacterium P01_D01_bin.105]
MDVLDKIDEKLRRKDRKVEARDIKAQLEEIANALEQLPVTSTDSPRNSLSAVTTNGLLQQMSDIGIFALMLVGGIVALRSAFWIGLAVMGIACVVWVAYKRFW